MAESNHPAVRKQGPLGRLLTAAVGFVFWLILGAIGNVMFEWTGMGLLWPEEGPKHSVAMLDRELGYLQDHFREGIFIRNPAEFAKSVAGRVHHKIYDEWNVDELIQHAEAGAGRAAGNKDFKQQLGSLSLDARNYLGAAVIATEVYAVRLAIMICALPVFLLAGIVGATDGIVQRDLRKFGGGRERGQVHHLARGAVIPIFTLPWVLYLSWPTSIDPMWVVLPFALFFGLAIQVSLANYKKYL